MDRGAWWATVHGVAKSQTRLSDSRIATEAQGRTLSEGGVRDRCTYKQGLPRCLSGTESASIAGDARDAGLIPGSGRSPGGGNGNPPQYSCLGNPMDRGN